MNKVALESSYGKYSDLSADKPKGQIVDREVEVAQSSRNWKIIAAISVVALGALSVIVYRNMYPPLKMTDSPFEMARPRNLYSILMPLCKKAVEERCTEDGPDGVLCLKDFLHKDWTPEIFGIERTSSDPLCFPPVSSKLKGFVSSLGGPSRFRGNYGETCTEISKKVYSLPEIQWLYKYLQGFGGGGFIERAGKIFICFKSHIA